MSNETFKIYPAHVAGVMVIIAAGAAFFIHPGLAVGLLLLYVILCVAACFFPQTNFLGPVISRGRTRENKVALTFDDGPDENTTVRILDLLDRRRVKATFFVSGVNALKYPDLIAEIVRRGHEIGNHSYSHDPLLMLKNGRALYREVGEARNVLRSMGVDALAFRPPVGIVNPKLFPVLREQGMICVTFNCRAGDAGNRRIHNLSGRILKKAKPDDIILLHDTPPRRTEDYPELWLEMEKILAGIEEKGLRMVPLSELIGKKISGHVPRTYFNSEFND